MMRSTICPGTARALVLCGTLAAIVGGGPITGGAQENNGGSVKLLQGHSETAYNVAFNPGSSMLASASFDSTIKFWDATTGKERASLRWHLNTVRCIAFSSDGLTLAAGSNRGTVRLWRAASRQEVADAGEWWR